MRPAQRLTQLRKGIKRPLQRAFARALMLPLDRRRRTVRDLDGLEPTRIVASRTDRIGDLLCSAPVLLALHRRWPRARLVVIAGPKNRAVLAGLPFVEAGPVFRRDPASWAELAWWLGRQRFDLSVSLRAESMAGVWIAAWSGAPVRMATHVTNTYPAANLILGADDAHHTTRYCRAAGMLGFPPADVRPVFIVPAEAARQADAVLAGMMTPNGEPLVGVQIPRRSSRRAADRGWPADKVVALVRQLAADGCRVVLCGVGGERDEAERLRALVPEAVVAPAIPFAVFAGLQRRFDLFVSPYTGTLHLADAISVPTVSYGLPEQTHCWGTIGPQHRTVTAATLAGITVEAVLGGSRSVLAQRRAPS
jgi:ADP-heptose:LPS heptosyltransferase